MIQLAHTWINFAYNRWYRSNNHALGRNSISHLWTVGGLRHMVVEVFVGPHEDSQRYARRRAERIGTSDEQRILGTGKPLSERARR